MRTQQRVYWGATPSAGHLRDRAMPMPTVRRVVTGHDASGKAIVLMDSDAPNQKLRQTGLVSTLLWVTDETPADISGKPTAPRARSACRRRRTARSCAWSIFRPRARRHQGRQRRDPARDGRRRSGRGAGCATRTCTAPERRLRDRAGRRDRHAARRLRSAPEGRRHPGAAGHQPRVGQQRQRDVPDRVRADRREGACGVAQAGQAARIDA